MVVIQKRQTVNKKLQLVNIDLMKIKGSSKINLFKSISTILVPIKIERHFHILEEAKVAHQFKVVCLVVYRELSIHHVFKV